MKIQHIRVWKEDLKLSRPYTIAYETISAVENVFISIETDTGLVGLGAGSPSPEVTGEDMEACTAALNLVPDLLMNKDIRDLNSLLRTLGQKLKRYPAALACADIALHDLAAQGLGLPLARLLGQTHKSLPTSITIGILPLEETLSEAKEYADRGFTILKVKTGIELETDIERITKIHEAFPRMAIRVDANQGYSGKDQIRFSKAVGHCVEFSEQPLAANHIKEMQALPEEIRNLSAADESLLGPDDVPALLQEPRPFGIFNIKLMKCGGIHPGMAIARMAEVSQTDLMWGCMDESIISISAALHAALASPATRYLDLDGSLDLARDLVKGGFILKDGKLSITDKAGLGVERMD
ncbi:MAG: dipeptide epimerase [Desulfobacterales bacterium]|nr:dipeptide epimerase [Desulfobacterales bacterium]